MSMSQNGQFVICDGEGCEARAPAPVASQSPRFAQSGQDAASAEGWLFVTAEQTSRHFCPLCKEKYLPRVASGEPIDQI